MSVYDTWSAEALDEQMAKIEQRLVVIGEQYDACADYEYEQTECGMVNRKERLGEEIHDCYSEIGAILAAKRQIKDPTQSA